jgi:hypothetical protein
MQRSYFRSFYHNLMRTIGQLPLMSGLRHFQMQGLVGHLLLVGSMSALDTKLMSELAALLEGAIGVALQRSQQDVHHLMMSQINLHRCRLQRSAVLQHQSRERRVHPEHQAHELAHCLS